MYVALSQLPTLVALVVALELVQLLATIVLIIRLASFQRSVEAAIDTGLLDKAHG
jgi:hypothetical protein